MYTLAGVTGRVGSVVADRLLAAQVPIRVLVRDTAKAAEWEQRGAQVAVGDLGDRASLRDALAGSDGFSALLPFDPAATDFHAQVDSQVAAIAGAVADTGVPHVTMLSSVGAHLPEGTGPIVALHRLEVALRETGTVLSAVRSGHFQEKVSEVLEVAVQQGIYPVFGDAADVATPMIATRDVGAAIADTVLAPPSADEVVHLDGPTYTERDVARLLSRALGRDLQVVTIPRPGWIPALIDAGLSPHIAEVMAGLYDADERGVLRDAPAGDRTVVCPTELATTLADLVRVPA